MNIIFAVMLVLVITLMPGYHAAFAAEVSVEADGMLNVNGERLFVLGLYENPEDDAVLERAVAAGVNLVQSKADVASLDRLHRHDVHAWVNTGNCIDLSENRDAREQTMRALVEATHTHPALLVWEVPDEALWNCWHYANVWRRHEEPGEQRKHIDALADNQLRARLLEQQAQVGALYGMARYVEADALADDIWRALNMAPPRPGFGLGDAIERTEKLRAGMVAGYHLLKELAPGRPVWMNHAPRNQLEQLAAFGKAADIVGCDIYPVPLHRRVAHSDLKNRALSSVGDYTQRMQASAPGKPVWMVLQGFGWGDIQPNQPEEIRRELRRPTANETRFMAFNAIVHGARGILYWGTSAVEKDSEFWASLLDVFSELRDLREVLAAPDAQLQVTTSFRATFGSVDRDIAVLPKAHGNIPWLLIVNEWTDPLVYTLHGLDAINGIEYRERYSGEQVRVEDGQVSLHIAPEAVHILAPVSTP